MRRPLVIIAAVAIVAALVASVRLLTAAASSTTPAAAPETSCGPGAQRLFGHVASIGRKGDHLELRFDPAWFLSGETANAAAAEDGAVTAGEPVPNDNYVVDESHRTFTYGLPASARITVLTSDGELRADGFPASRITPDELAALVSGEQPVKLFEPLDTGFWMEVDVDTVCSLAQQYHP